MERLVGSTSLPGGNQVDGLPPASSYYSSLGEESLALRVIPKYLGRRKQTKHKYLELARSSTDRHTTANDRRHSRGRDQMEGALLISLNPTLQKRCPGITFLAGRSLLCELLLFRATGVGSAGHYSSLGEESPALRVAPPS